MYPLPDVSFAAAQWFTGALSATLCFTWPQGFSIGEPQTKELAPDRGKAMVYSRQRYGLSHILAV
jgi:hypothetical protein